MNPNTNQDNLKSIPPSEMGYAIGDQNSNSATSTLTATKTNRCTKCENMAKGLFYLENLIRSEEHTSKECPDILQYITNVNRNVAYILDFIIEYQRNPNIDTNNIKESSEYRNRFTNALVSRQFELNGKNTMKVNNLKKKTTPQKQKKNLNASKKSTNTKILNQERQQQQQPLPQQQQQPLPQQQQKQQQQQQRPEKVSLASTAKIYSSYNERVKKAQKNVSKSTVSPVRRNSVFYATKKSTSKTQKNESKTKKKIPKKKIFQQNPFLDIISVPRSSID